MVTTRSKSGTINKTKAARAKSSAKCGTTNTVDPNLQEMTTRSMSRKNDKAKATRAKSSPDYGTTKKVDPKMKEKVILKKYFEEHPVRRLRPRGLPYEVDFAGQAVWRNMSDEAKFVYLRI
ncbi:hypothetical protein OROGR_002357 [Orobanche gracilis]